MQNINNKTYIFTELLVNVNVLDQKKKKKKWSIPETGELENRHFDVDKILLLYRQFRIILEYHF